MRILHVVHGCDERPGPGHDLGVLSCRAAVEAWPEHDHDVCLVGSTAAAARARVLGLTATVRVSPTLGRTIACAGRLRRLAVRLPRADLVQCWNPELVPLARRALGPRAPVAVATPAALELAAGTAGPGKSPAALAHERKTLREALGIPDAVPLVGLLSDSPASADAEAFSNVLSLSDACGSPVFGAAQRGAASIARARRFLQESGFRYSLVLTPAPVWRWLAACDAAILAPRTGSRLDLLRVCVLLCHRAGVPVLALRDPAWADVYPPELAGALLGERHVPDSRSDLLAALLKEGRGGATATMVRRSASDPARTRAVREAIERSWARAVGPATAPMEITT